MGLKITGKLPSGKHKIRLQQSPQYKEGSFRNLSDTPMKPEGVTYWKMLREFFKKHPDTAPPKKLPAIKTDLKNLPDSPFSLIWFGHSSYLLRIGNKNILIDPVFSGNAAPFSFMVKAFPGSNRFTADDMPQIDWLILTHDHYDHLDFKTIRRLRNKVGQIICSLGMRSHLAYWGIRDDMITELDWWDSLHLTPEIHLQAAPARHFSGRGIKRGQTLWSSFILKTRDHKIYIGGDSGYDSHFSDIGKRYGPFDLAILESGQYNTMWPFIHMMPEEMVQAAVDLQAKSVLPVHWGKFRLSMHPWNEPIQRVLQHAAVRNMPVITPMIGELVNLDGKNGFKRWWEF
jgi:L-ascorbate metabolism protein UlaG (beta-lactamase superfamily)